MVLVRMLEFERRTFEEPDGCILGRSGDTERPRWSGGGKNKMSMVVAREM